MSCDNLFQQMAGLKDRALAAYCIDSSGIPFLRPIIIRTFLPETNTYSYVQISPTPYAKKDPKPEEPEVGGLGNVTGEQNRYTCSISRQYTEDQLDNQFTDFIIDGDLVALEGGDRFSGILCELDSIHDKVVSWELILLENISEQQFTLGI